MLFIILIIIIIPVFGSSFLIVNETISLSSSISIEKIGSILQDRLGKEQTAEIMYKIYSESLNYIKRSFTSWIESVANFIVSIIILFFMLFFMFLRSDDMAKKFKEYVPFNKKNTNQLIRKAKEITNSTVMSSGLIALGQGFLTSIGFLIFGIPGAIVWGLITAFVSFLPAIGAPLVYVTAGIIYILQQDYFTGIGIIAWGALLVSSVDNILRPIIGERIGKIHPLITLFGVVIGIRYFGLIGVVVGPLLLSYLFLIIDIYKKEYI